MNIERSLFGTTREGRPVKLFTCSNARGTVLKMINYGATITALEVADRTGQRGNITLGFETVAGYERHNTYFGATIGRFGSRIAGARFNLGGREYILTANVGATHQHGGWKGFDKIVWDAEPVRGEDFVGIRFAYTSTDGEEGYPGTLDVIVVYTLNNDDELRIEYSASTDAATVINLTNHAYWNLSAGSNPIILDHLMQIEADQFLDIDGEMIPTHAEGVTGSAMDFTSPKAIGEHIGELKQNPDGSQGYDHNFILRCQDGTLARAAFVTDPNSGRTLEILTTEPGVQFYSGNFLDGSAINGSHPQHAAFCLETQHFPNSPNRPDFPSVVLEPGENYRSVTVYSFGHDAGKPNGPL